MKLFTMFIQIPKIQMESQGITTTDAILTGFNDVLVNLPEHLSIQPIKYRQFVENFFQLLGYKRLTLSVRLERLKVLIFSVRYCFLLLNSKSAENFESPRVVFQN